MKRKGTQLGTLRERKGKWIAVYSAWVVDKGGLQWKQVSKTLGAAKDLSERAARRELGALVSDANRRAKQPFIMFTFGEFVQRHFIPTWVSSKEKRGVEHYTGILERHVMPHLGSVPISELSVLRIQSFMDTLRNYRKPDGKPLAVQTLHHVKNVVSSVFSHMQRVEVWEKLNPCSKVVLPKLVNEKRTALQAWQVESLVMELQKAGYQQTALMVQFLAWTGLRIGEACGLRWDRLNLSAQPVRLGDVVVEPKEFLMDLAFSHSTFTGGKTGPRIVGIVDKLIPLLLSHRTASKSEYVFSTQKGTPFDEHNVLKRHLRPALERAGLPSISWHDLRHTFVTESQRNGLSLVEVAATVGHKSLAVTGRYTHIKQSDVTRKLNEKKGIESWGIPWDESQGRPN